MCAMIITCGAGCALCVASPILTWLACEYENELIHIASIASLLIGEILIWIYLAWFLMTRV